MKHIILKPTREIKINFDYNELLGKVIIPEESVKKMDDYLDSDMLSDEFGDDVMLVFQDKMVYGFDYLQHGNKDRIFLPEINPILFFYGNAQMFFKMIYPYKKKFLSTAIYISGRRFYSENADFSNFAFFFQLSINYIINLQAALESFLNQLIPSDYKFYSLNNRIIKNPSIHSKLEEIQKIKNLNYQDVYPGKYKIIKEIIDFRNNIVHLKPSKDVTNTKYKDLYRNAIDFPYNEAIYAVRDFINFFENNLIEECRCGKEYHFDIFHNEK